MSDLTVALLGRPRQRSSTNWDRVLRVVANRLLIEHGMSSLGNFRDPIREIFYIVLSAKTTESLYKRAFQELWGRYPGITSIASAPLSAIRRCIGFAGLGHKRAIHVKAIASSLRSTLGQRPASALRKYSAPEAYSLLRSLPGVGPKSALCVMLFSLDFDVFPVDAHVQRVLARIGIIPRAEKHYRAQHRLPAFVPNGLSKTLHVTLIQHGRKVCRATNPNCTACVLVDVCRHGQKQNHLLS